MASANCRLPVDDPQPQRSPRIGPRSSPGEVPVASYGENFSQPRATPAVRYEPSSTWSTGPPLSAPQPPTARSMTEPRDDGLYVGVCVEPRGRPTNDESLPSSSFASSAGLSQSDHGPPLAQPPVKWAEIDFQNLRLPPAPTVPIPTPASLLGSSFSSPTPQMMPRGVANAASSDAGHKRHATSIRDGEGRATAPHPRKRPREHDTDAPNRRRRVQAQDVRSIGVDTSERAQRTRHRIEAPQTDRTALASPESSSGSGVVTPTPIRDPYPSHLHPSMSLKRAPGAGLVNSAVPGNPSVPTHRPALLGAPVSEEMDVDEVPRHLEGSPEGGARSHASMGPPMNLPLVGNQEEHPFTFQFGIQTPQQQYDVLARPLAQIPRSEPPPPPMSGSYTVRDVVQPHPAVENRLPPFEELQRHADGGSARMQAHVERRPLADITPPAGSEDRLSEENQENAAPQYVPRVQARGFSVFREHQRDHSAPRDIPSGSRATSSMSNRLTMGPPVVGSRLPLPPRVPPLTAHSGRPGLGVPFPPTMIRRLRPPRNGFPVTVFDDPDSLVYGMEESFVTRIRTEKLRSENESEPLVARFVLLDGLPPGDMAVAAMKQAHDAIKEITGEEAWVVPPRPSKTDVLAIAWFVRGLSKAAATTLLDMKIVTTPYVTFFVFPNAVEPRLVLTLGGFWSNIGGQIEEMIRSTFAGPDILGILAQCVEVSPIFKGVETLKAVDYLLETLDVKVFTMPKGAIYACAYLVFPEVETTTWRYLRAAVAAVAFEDGYNSQAVPWTFRCGVCGANDHPEDICVWPTLDGWLGPIPQVALPQPEPLPQPGATLVFRPRGLPKDGRGGGSRQRGGRSRTGPQQTFGDGAPFASGSGDGRRDGSGPGAAGPSTGAMRAF